MSGMGQGGPEVPGTSFVIRMILLRDVTCYSPFLGLSFPLWHLRGELR